MDPASLRPGRPVVWLLAALALVVGVGGCGLTPNDKPHAIAPGDLPADLLDPNPPTSTTIPGSTATITVYLVVREGDTTRLAPVAREAADASDAGALVAALLAPSSPEELQDGLTSSIPTGTTLIGTSRGDSDDELVVNLSGSLVDVQGPELANAFAQIVWTVTELDGVRKVRFQIDGAPQLATNDEGIEQPGAVMRSDYDALAPER
jgi:spore germination protein GerM